MYSSSLTHIGIQIWINTLERLWDKSRTYRLHAQALHTFQYLVLQRYLLAMPVFVKMTVNATHTSCPLFAFNTKDTGKSDFPVTRSMTLRVSSKAFFCPQTACKEKTNRQRLNNKILFIVLVMDKQYRDYSFIRP